jgi:hypothetical protein
VTHEAGNVLADCGREQYRGPALFALRRLLFRRHRTGVRPIATAVSASVSATPDSQSSDVGVGLYRVGVIVSVFVGLWILTSWC